MTPSGAGTVALPPRQGGFSLIEVLVAFFIFALVVGVALSAVSGAVRTADTSRDYSRAMTIAENKLARAGADISLEQGGADGTAGDDYRWELSVQRLGSGGADDDLAVDAYRVQVWVSWQDGRRERDVHLQTVKLRPDARASH